MSYEAVWLKHGFSKCAHSLEGYASPRRWATKCGLNIQKVTDGKVEEQGFVISWDLLNHERIERCAKCFRPVDQEGRDA